MRISPAAFIEGRRILYTIGKIQAASAWHAANDSPRQDHWREHVVEELIHKAEDLGADAIVDFGYENSGPIRDSDTGVQLKCILATGMAVKLSCAA
ncbi:MAG: heavy metal-binding domain-containing protein [Methylocapsa sp.]|nr:heavy metal-binding domain-containing protein [Methylocapsa sp.]